MKQFKKYFVLLALVSILMALNACKAKGTPTPSPEMVITNVALTVQADLTEMAAQIPTNTSTPEITPTLTAEPITPTPTFTLTPTGPTPTNTSSFANDNGVWVESNPPDGTFVTPGQEFTITVTLMNTGDTTWTSNYYIQFFSGEQMGAPEKIYMPYPIPPTKNVQIAIDFQAPESIGLKHSDWRIVNAQDEGIYLFWIEVEVASEPQPTATP